MITVGGTMRAMKAAVLVVALASGAFAQSPDPPLADSRLTVHTLVREDIFSAFVPPIDMARFERGERNIEQLLRDRPAQKGNLLAWRGSASMTRAVLAHEAGNAAEFSRRYQTAIASFDEAAKQTSGSDAVLPITGGSLSVLADRLPQQHRAEAWTRAYAVFSALWKAQGPAVEKLPVHFQGELLGGLAQAAQRTGRTEESALYVDRMLTLMQGTPYETTAKQWKADPASAATSKLTCKNCHDPGRLSSRLAALTKSGQ
jgi:hypothetical protein